MTAQFAAIGGGNIDLSSLTASGTDASDNVVLSTVDEYGAPVDNYSWNDWAIDGKACWVDEAYSEITGVTLPAGLTFWTSGSMTDQVIQSAGEVPSKDVSIALREGYTLVGNPFPVAVALQDVVVGGEEASDNVTMSTIDEYGAPIMTYSWNDWAIEGKACWVDEGYAEIEGVSIAPGQGLWTSGSNDSQFVRFPAPEL